MNSERSKTRSNSTTSVDSTPVFLRTPLRTPREHLLFSAIKRTPKPSTQKGDLDPWLEERHSNSELSSDLLVHESVPHEVGKKAIEHEKAMSEPGSGDSYAAFVIGEVREHLRDIHLEISALRSRLESDGPTNRVPKRVSPMSSGKFDLENSATEASESELSPNDRIRLATLQDDHPESPEDVAPNIPELEAVTMDWASAVPVADSRDGSKVVPVDEFLASFEPSSFGNRYNTATKVRTSMTSEGTSSMSRLVKKERLESLYTLRAHHTRRGPEIWQRAVLSYISIRECVMKQRLPTRGLEKFMSFPQVQALVVLCVCLNSVFTGVSSNVYMQGCFNEYHEQADAELRSYTPPSWIDVGDIIFSCVFLVELLLRLIGEECRFFFCNEWRWNLFDFIVEMVSLVSLLALTGSTAPAQIVQNLRLLKIARAFRAIRMIRHMPWMYDLRFMTLAIMNSVVPLFWACVVLIIFLFVTAIVLVQGVAANVLSTSALDEERIEEYFDSVGGTMLTLFMSMTGGLDWRDPFRVLEDVHWFYGVLFVLFIACSALAVLNIITSIFVTDAIEVAHMDMDLRMRGELDNSRKAVKELKNIFAEMDVGGTDMVTSAMLERALQNRRVRAQFALLDLDITDAVSFFHVLDVDGGGFVDISEFVMGCLRLKGHTNLIDVEVSLMDIKQMLKTALSEQRFLGSQLVGQSVFRIDTT